MKVCPFCAEEIQDAAKVCKHCGRDLAGGASQVQIVQPKKQTSAAAMGCAVIIGLCGLGYCVTLFNKPTPSTAPAATAPRVTTPPTTLTPAEAKKRQAEIARLAALEAARGPEPVSCRGRFLKHLGMFDKGPPCVVEQYLSLTLKDPASYEQQGPCAMEPGKTSWTVQCTFRARNSFGGLNLQTLTFQVKNDQIIGKPR